MKRFLLLFFVILIGLGMLNHSGCKKSEITGPDMSIVDVRWILQSIKFSSTNVVPIVDTFFIMLNGDSSIDMSVDFNDCAGSYTLGDNNSIYIDYNTIACTEVYCGDDSMDDEFHDALNSASRYEVEGNELKIYFNNGQSYLNFVAESS
jgi:heat shock protein HslJ